MKFKLVETLEKATPYMLRNDGELLECGDIHPYILKISEDIKEIINGWIDLDALYWFYNNTKKEYTKKSIRAIAKYFIKKFGIKDDFTVSIYGNKDVNYNFGFDEKTYQIKDGEIAGFVETLNYDTNQEFCRVRTSSMLWGGTSNDIYFRVSSIGFNWFPIIWNIVYKYREGISTVTICKDSSTFGGTFNPYSIDGKKLYMIDVDDFITLGGNPIIEKVTSELDAINHARKKLSNGFTISEAYDWIHPVQVVKFYNKQIREELEFDLENLLHR